MNDDRVRLWPRVALSVVGALALAIVPLPLWLDSVRPSWLALLVIYWVLYEPRRVGLLTVWLAGIMLDTLHGSLLGQHALALVVIGFATQRFNLRVRVFPMSQQVATVFMLVAMHEFILFWVDGVSGQSGGDWRRWLAVVSSAACWPIVQAIMQQLHEPAAARDSV